MTTTSDVAMHVVDACSKVFGVTRADVMNKNRSASVVLARQSAYWILRYSYGMSWNQIGGLMEREHSTVLQQAGRMEWMMIHRPYIAALVNGILIDLKRDPVPPKQAVRS